MALNVKLENFEGPFDLLLHLIKKNEMSIYEIRINEVASQYMQYIKSMKEMDLEIASEFIVIASALVEIKSKELLPKVKKEDEDIEDEEDIKKQLVEKLVEYKKFKNVAALLRTKENVVGEMYSKKPEIIEEEKTFDLGKVLKDVTMLSLNNLFNDLMEEYLKKMNTDRDLLPKQITALEAYKIEDKMETLKEYIEKVDKGSFREVMESCKEKMEVVVTFLALLELIKLKVIRVVQEGSFKEIYMERVVNNE